MLSPIAHSWSGRRVAHVGAVVVLALAASACTSLRVHSAAEPAAGVGSDIALRALAHLGVPYRFGGDEPSRGFDCSGLVRHVYRDALGVDLPRRSEDIGRAGRAVERERLQPGDLVFFNTQGSAFSHVGVYVGAGRFVHAPAGGGHVRIDALHDRYWATRFDGARRLTPMAERSADAFAERGEVGDPSVWRSP